MSAADKIQAARALIEPLTGHDDGPWAAKHRGTRDDIARGEDFLRVTTERDAADPDAVAIVHLKWRQNRSGNAALIAAAPSLRETVAALADLADAQAQKLEAQAVELARAKSRGDNHWETLKGIRHIAKTSGDIERIILWVNDAGSGYMATPEASLAEVCDERNAARAEADALAQENARLRGCFEQIEEAALNGCLTPDLVARITRAALGDAP